jgi:hypothetical protein
MLGKRGGKLLFHFVARDDGAQVVDFGAKLGAHNENGEVVLQGGDLRFDPLRKGFALGFDVGQDGGSFRRGDGRELDGADGCRDGE